MLYTLTLFFYGNPNSFCCRGNEDGDLFVSSSVMSCFLELDEKPVYDLSPPAILTFKTLVSAFD